MNSEKTAVIFIGYQNDYFAEDGILRGAIEESASVNNTFGNSLKLIEKLRKTDATLIQTPIVFTSDYSELSNPVGILRIIRDVGAFRENTSGAEIVDEFKAYGDAIRVVSGKHGLNAFSNTELDEILEEKDIENVVLVGAVTSICIDSTGRSAHDRGYRVHVLSDCTCGRSEFEQNFFCTEVLPLYASVCSAEDFLAQIQV